MNAFVVWAAEPQMEVSQAEAQAHLVKKDEPVYPVFAKAAGVDGIVHVRVGVGTNGRVGALLGSSGPPSLLKAAEDAVLSYVYKPFESDGKPVYVSDDSGCGVSLAEPHYLDASSSPVTRKVLGKRIRPFREILFRTSGVADGAFFAARLRSHTRT